MSLLLQAYRGEKTERPPIWLMRQAGRYLPEYQAIRAEHSINEIINNVELTTEVTLQPLRRFDLDAAIIFADLLTPFQGFGIDFDFKEKEGPVVATPIESSEDVEQISEFDINKVSSTINAAENLVSKLPQDTPLIGFAGAPFTVSSYLIEGRSNPKLNRTKVFMFNEPEAWHKLQTYLVAALKEYLLAQVKAGCRALQIFDSWLGGLSKEQYELYVQPYLEDLLRQLKAETDVPIVFFGTNLSALRPAMHSLPADVLGLDWRENIADAHTFFQGKFALQGNLDPLMLFAPLHKLDSAIDAIFENAQNLPGYTFNLGHGILPKTPISSVQRLVERVVAL